MLDIPESTLRDQMAHDNLQVTEAKIPTRGGVQGARVISSSVVFRLAIKLNPELAFQMGDAGANLYMLGLAGYKTQVVEKAPTNQIPEAFQANSFEWGDRNKSKQKWEIKKLLKPYKGNIFVLVEERENFLMLHALTEASVRVLTWYSDLANARHIHEMFVVSADKFAKQKDCQLQGNFIASFE